MNSTRPKHIDLTYLNTMSDGDQEFIRSMLESFIRNVPQHLTNIRLYLEQKEWDALAGEVHKLKPTLKYLGVNSMNALILETEVSCKERKNLDQVEKGIADIITIAEHVINEARDMVATD